MYNRFQEILRMIRFDDAVVGRPHKSPDKVQPIRKVFDV